MNAAAPLQAASAVKAVRTASPGLLLQRKCACGGSNASIGSKCEDCQSKGLQRKLFIGFSNDPLELEADRIADQVMSAPGTARVGAAPLSIQRFSGHVGGDGGVASASVDRALASPGRPLEPALRRDMERGFGYDFSRVRVHTGGVAEQSARDVRAKAYTVGSSVVFGAGGFAPGTHDGRRLIAHELTHVVQQGGRPPAVYLQRDASDEPCGPVGFGSDWSVWARIDGGPYADQGIAIPYDKLVPLSDPMADFDRAESKKTFKDASRLEQVYYDATQPIWKFKDRWRASWWLCSVVEPLAREIGAKTARDLNSPGCLTIQNCGVNWGTVLGNFSDHTASGQRNRTLLLKGFTDTALDIGLSLQIINYALMLGGGYAAARAGLAKGMPTPAAVPVAPKPVPPPEGVSPAAASPAPQVTPMTSEVNPSPPTLDPKLAVADQKVTAPVNVTVSPPAPATPPAPTTKNTAQAQQQVADAKASVDAARQQLNAAQETVRKAEGEAGAAKNLSSRSGSKSARDKLLKDTQDNLNNARRELAERQDIAREVEAHAAATEQGSQRVASLEKEAAAIQSDIEAIYRRNKGKRPAVRESPDGEQLGKLTARKQVNARELNDAIRKLNTKRDPLDVAVDPKPPAAKATGTIGKTPAQEAELQRDIQKARALQATDIRVNQEQVSAAMKRVGVNRPDLQFTLPDGRRVYIEYDRATSARGPAHGTRIKANDPHAVVVLRTVD